MDIHTFIANYQEAFGQHAELPIAFWYSDRMGASTEKVTGCLFKCMKQVRDGKIVSLSNETITCGGGKFYTGFTEMPERVPGFVSLKEKYKKTPEMVVDFVNELQISRTDKAYLHFARIDKIPSFDEVEGLLFLPTPDILSGLATWTFFDNNASDAVAAPFGSGCCSVITQTIIENRKQGKRTFLGFFDPSVRPYFEADLLSFTIPMSPVQGDVSHHARKLSVRYTCLGKNQGKDTAVPIRRRTYPPLSHFLPHPSGHLSAGNQNRRCRSHLPCHRHTPGLLKNMAAICG